ncbi:hypothetical protein [Bartonella rattimassiliensis]|uniref:Uncharacterized protein n=1 Tax=Bartonella rattimassiliensis 15908 TaxID=1094556 RepID=J1JU55_9HYPH|nr:hypothetical protein [Bartonella rattimassiliensis]EJF88020.1 hypothetical protein MCY_00017 [Bartonella rattimassiliensis 15908]
MTALFSDPKNLKFTQSDQYKTFAYMVALIQDEIDDTTAEYSQQIQDSIVTALRLCEHELFFFNEKREKSFKTQNGQTWYGQKEGVIIESEKVLEGAFLVKKDKTQTKLFFKPVQVLYQQYGMHPELGTPFFYTCLNQKIGLFPTPEQVETIKLSYVPIYFADEQLKESHNPWLVHAFDLIKARAKYELYKNILKDPEYAAVSFRDFQEQLQALRIETSRRKDSSKIRSMSF